MRPFGEYPSAAGYESTFHGLSPAQQDYLKTAHKKAHNDQPLDEIRNTSGGIGLPDAAWERLAKDRKPPVAHQHFDLPKYPLRLRYRAKK